MEETKTLRDSIREGLGEKWTKEIEDGLFWTVSTFVDGACQAVYKKGREDELTDLRRAGIIA